MTTASTPQPDFVADGDVLMEARALTRRFGGLVAVNSVDFRLRKGSILSVIGPNGAGKTTLFNMITGLVEPSSGTLVFNHDVGGGRVHPVWLAGHPSRNTNAIRSLELVSRAVVGLVLASFVIIVLLWLLGNRTLTALLLFVLLPLLLLAFLAVRVALRVLINRGRPPHYVTMQGISRTFQNIRLFANMTALENVLVGMHTKLHGTVVGAIFRPPWTMREERNASEKGTEILKTVGLEWAAGQAAKNLPYGDQRRLEIARALANDPKLLLLDEPTAGMNPQETAVMMRFIKQLQVQRGLTILLIEHDMKVVMGISDHIIVLDYGSKIAEGSPEEVRANPRVIEAYLGKPSATAEEAAPAAATAEGGA